ncbi:HNH endonuclease [Alkalimonas mucilaginosa]|uniref:HNH endonuclease n=1 Tax=Alkalimonas mucilaginosa TaxID=3057676 RepID=A0ABU7JI61_9GAMM|nr:HNH endonuclease [Alkalimonas sp. MEB004]MEE2025357.1 HNH endonuclease [Alkalimonas sp. MEB004]
MYSRAELHYKDGSQVSRACHLDTTEWYRETRITNKSRKPFTCACGCNIPTGSTYLTLEMMAGSGRADAIADFALCSVHQEKTEALLGRPISTDIDTDEIIRAWVQILQSESDMTNNSRQQIEASTSYAAIDSQAALRSYSWEIRSEICAVKTVDKTLRVEGSTGIPMDVVPFFTGQQLDEKQECVIEFSFLDTVAQCTISRKQGRHRLFLAPLKQKLLQLGIQIGDLLFFERNVSVANRFNISVLNQKNEVVTQLSPQSKVGEERAAYRNVRVGHEIFRERVKRVYSYRCCLSGLEDTAPSILIASHIKPWSLAKPEEKTDIFNGLLLAPHYDKLFDKGLISFADDGNIMLSSQLPDQVVQKWDLENKRLHTVYPQSATYLDFHREHFKF